MTIASKRIARVEQLFHRHTMPMSVAVEIIENLKHAVRTRCDPHVADRVNAEIDSALDLALRSEWDELARIARGETL